MAKIGARPHSLGLSGEITPEQQGHFAPTNNQERLEAGLSLEEKRWEAAVYYATALLPLMKSKDPLEAISEANRLAIRAVDDLMRQLGK